jgi:hypothetical protein
MSESVKALVWIPLIVLWVFTLLVRFFPPLKREVDTPQAQKISMISGWVALVGALVVIFGL